MIEEVKEVRAKGRRVRLGYRTKRVCQSVHIVYMYKDKGFMLKLRGKSKFVVYTVLTGCVNINKGGCSVYSRESEEKVNTAQNLKPFSGLTEFIIKIFIHF